MDYVDASQVKPYPDICGEIRELVRTDDYSTALVKIKAGKLTGQHYHKKMVETYHIIHGEGIFYCGDQEYELKPDVEVCIEPGEEHQTRANSELELLVITSPPFTVKDIFEV